MTAAEQPEARPSRRRRVLAALALLLLAALLLLWLARVPIAGRFIDRSLAAKHVPARYTIVDLGFGRQRLTDVVIGDPAHPDLVADWVETHVDVGLSGPSVTRVRAGRVRMRGRLVDGKVSLGAIDRLLPPPSGKPFALPAIDLAVADGRMRLETPSGPVGLKLTGSGRLDDGFRGTLAAVAPRLAAGGCETTGLRVAVRLAVDRARPSITGPVGATRLACGATTVAAPAARIAATFSAALDRWQGRATLQSGRVAAGDVATQAIGGRIDFTGSAASTAGALALTATMPAMTQARAERAALDGRFRLTQGAVAFEGIARAGGAALSRTLLASLVTHRDAATGTPAGPLLLQASDALVAAGRRFDLDADVALAGAVVRIDRAQIASASGARLALADGAGLTVDRRGWRIDGTATIGGGGLPSGRIALSRPSAGAPVTGTASFAPYVAGDARLELTPARFSAAANGATRIETVAALSGPLGDGRVTRLRTPLVARWAGDTLTVNPACAPLAFDALAVSGLRLAPARLTLCPLDGGVVRIAGGRIGGGATLAASRLTGAIGSTPLTLAAKGAAIRFGARGFNVDDVAARLGSADRLTRLDIGHLEGRFAGSGLAGQFAGAGGQIGNVPLLLSQAAGGWTLAGGRLALTGALQVADAAADPRFKPLAGRDVRLTLAGGRIAATGALYEPSRSVKVADVTLAHDLSRGGGSADLIVLGLAFTKEFQPDLLTRLTFGIIADVRGTVTGAGHIAWTPDGVTSNGVFKTDGTDLAAAFGPVTGIAGTITFTDLLNLQSAPDQVATVKTINPGIAVEDGRIVYQTLPGNRIKVESGKWPFAGGTLTLEPTLLDFSEATTRAMTFTVAGMDAGKFLQQFDFKNLDATGTFDGTLPMLFDERGGRIENGRLTVRPGGGTIAYVGDLTEKDLGVWGNIAFQALKSLKYRNLGIVMNGPLAGEMITEVRFAGVSQGDGAKSNFLIRRLQNLPFVFNIRIKAPFRGLIDSAQSFYDPKRLIQRNLQPLLQQQLKATAPPVQPRASEIVPPAKQD